MSSQATACSRREFVKVAGAAALASAVKAAPILGAPARRRYAIVGTGHRATGMWGKELADRYGDVLEFVGLCDVNPKRAAAGRALIGVDCPTFTSFDEMCDRSKPELLLVATVDSTHTARLRRNRTRRSREVVLSRGFRVENGRSTLGSWLSAT